MLIAFEGLDRLGKSTLASKISTMFAPKLNIIKIVTSKDPDGLVSLKDDCREFGFNMPDFFEELVIIETLLQSRADNIILDRTIVSADVYRLNPLPESIWDFWLRRFIALNGIYIWVDGEYEFYLKRLRELGELGTSRVMDPETWNKRRGEFTRYYINIKNRIGESAIHIFNSEEDGLEDIAEEIVKRLIVLYTNQSITFTAEQ